jgi:hypothetical protein
MIKFFNTHKDFTFFAGLVIAVAAIYLVGAYRPITEMGTTWLIIMGIMVLFVILASALITPNPWLGWMINEQNRMSLSRLQMFMWTVMIFSAFVTAVLANLHFGYFQNAVAITIPQELWLAMGISVTSMVGSGLILEGKKDKSPKDPAQNIVDAKDGTVTGVLVDSVKPSLLDLIRGEEVGNYDIIDLTRLQNLFITFVLVGTYMASIGSMFTTLVTVAPAAQNVAANFPITVFPALGSSAVALLAISHSGYLVAKAIDNQPSVQNPG